MNDIYTFSAIYGKFMNLRIYSKMKFVILSIVLKVLVFLNCLFLQLHIAGAIVLKIYGIMYQSDRIVAVLW